MGIQLYRIGTPPPKRSIPGEQSVDTGTCPDAFVIDGEPKANAAALLAFIGTRSSIAEVSQLVHPCHEDALAARVAAGRSLGESPGAVTVPASVIIDAASQIGALIGLRTPNLGFTVVAMPASNRS